MQVADSEADSDNTEPTFAAFDTTDWARGRRLKKLHALLHSRQVLSSREVIGLNSFLSRLKVILTFCIFAP
jgi:hypothetical protein